MPYDIDPQLLAGVSQQPNFRPTFGQNVRGLLGNQDLALALLANSGASPQKRGFGEIFGTSMLQANQMKQGREDDAFKRQYQLAQLQNLKRSQSPYGAIQPDKFTPESLAQFEKTQQYSDLKLRPIGMQTGRYNPGDFTPESWASFLSSNDPAQLVRYVTPQNATVEKIGGGYEVVQPDKTGLTPPRRIPLSSRQQEVDAAAQLKAAEGQAGAIGAGQGGIIADIQKKGASAKTINNVLDLADPLIDASTGSLAGAGLDKLAGAFGKSLSGAEASAQLQVLQAGLMLNQPRMEGPQSDADVALYRAAAGQIGDPTVPGGIKKAALKTIRQLQQKYADRASQPFRLSPGAAPSTYDAETTSLLDKYAPK
jgi:hypothetical protein